MGEVEVPPFFLYPISLDIMKDPVTVSTGIAYDRESVEKWIFSEKNSACPVTKQVISDSDLTPNITIWRLIQSWCTLNASYGIKRFRTPKPPINKAHEKRDCEMILVVLDQVCQCAEGRAELLNHGAALAIVSKKILRVSKMASERAVRILVFVSKFSATPSVLQDMLNLGVVAKLCLVLQVDCGSKTQERAREILKLHAKAWKNSACIPMNSSSAYQS